MNGKRHIGCCGAYCRTCKPYVGGHCKGCKLGFDSGERDIAKAKCRIKRCCFAEKGLDTCADCPDFDSCGIIGAWYAKKGYKYRKYRQALAFIRSHGYPAFIAAADKWKNACGPLD